MPIQVTCPKCLSRFSVADQYAGKQGPCPKCKSPIKIPTLEEAVVIHAPAASGPVDAKGRSVLKTERRKDSKFSPILAISVASVVLLTLLAAFLLRDNAILAGTTGLGILGGGAALLGPLLAWAGYQFLRDDELEPYRGRELWLRAAACGVIYAGLWFVYGFLLSRFFTPEQITAGLEWWYPAIFMAVTIAAGTLVSYVAFDLEPFSGAMHFALFLVVTILLRLVMDLPMLPGLLLNAKSLT